MPEPTPISEVDEKRNRVGAEIQGILDREGMELKVVQTIVVVPKQ